MTILGAIILAGVVQYLITSSVRDGVREGLKTPVEKAPTLRGVTPEEQREVARWLAGGYNTWKK